MLRRCRARPRAAARPRARTTTTTPVATVREWLRSRLEAVAREEVAGGDSDADREPGGKREARDRAQESLHPPRARARRQRQHEGGDADRDRGGDRELAREEGKVAVGSATASPTTATNTVLVTNSWATRWMLRRIWRPSATIPGHDAEVVADEHEVGDRPRHLRSRALRDREASLLERGHVVDAVADHRHVAPGRRQRVDDRALAVRRDAADGRRRQDRLAQRLRLGRAAPRRRARAPIRARRRRARSHPTVAGASPERTFSSTSCSAKKATVSDAFGRSRSASTTRPSACTSAGKGGSGSAGGSGASDRPNASTRRPVPASRGACSTSAGSTVAEALRRSQHEALVAEVERAPAPARRERHLRRPPRAARPPPGSASAIACSVRLRVGALAA